MKKEFLAEFDLYGNLNKDEWQNKDILDGLVGKTPKGLPKGWDTLNEFSRLQILAETLTSDKRVEWKDEKDKEHRSNVKDYARTGALQHKEKGGLLYWYYEGDYRISLLDTLHKMSDILNLTNYEFTISSSFTLFPAGSWAVQLVFTLRKPYISKDDTDFYILDNPVKKEWVFKVPYVAPSQWKGALRATMVRELVAWWQSLDPQGKNSEEFAMRRFRLALLFGDEKGEEPGAVKGLAKYLDDVGGKEAAGHFRRMLKKHFDIPEDKSTPNFQGRLHFYPTYFDKIGLEVINPHDRKTGAGKNPIYFECVPAGTQGTFTLLYVPLDLSDNLNEAQKQAQEDLKAVANGIHSMLTVYGFGAKTSSGYGVADVSREKSKILPEKWRDLFWRAWEAKNV